MATLNIGFPTIEEEEEENNIIKCSRCEILVINNTPCHETGCPNARKGYYKAGEWISTEEEIEEEDYYIPDDGYADGGEPYTEEELEIINKK